MRAWFSLDVAATLVAERALAKLILGAVSDKLMLLRSHIDNRVAHRLNKIADAATEAIAALATDR
jgi:hypothetical protein